MYGNVAQLLAYILIKHAFPIHIVSFKILFILVAWLGFIKQIGHWIQTGTYPMLTFLKTIALHLNQAVVNV